MQSGKGIICLSVFDGISCGRIALERAGIKVDKYYASEIDKYAEKISASNYPDIIRLGDITKWREWNIETPDIILAGFPCQPYSVAGKRKGLDDKRGGNIVDCMIGVIEKYQPKDFLLENVTGLLSIDKGETFKTILSELNRAGYAVDWITINSALVSAQNRERLYILGKRLDKCKGLEYYIDIDSSNKKNYQNSLF
jgi:DNA-cytosine methyltransferase